MAPSGSWRSRPSTTSSAAAADLLLGRRRLRGLLHVVQVDLPRADHVLVEHSDDVVAEEVVLPGTRKATGLQPTVEGHGEHGPGPDVQQFADLGGGEHRRVLLSDGLVEVRLRRGKGHGGKVYDGDPNPRRNTVNGATSRF